MNLTKKDIKRFWAKVEIRGPDECWKWIAWKSKGYGMFSFESKSVSSHRVSWFIHFGYLPSFNFYTKSLVLHHCDNKACVNPKHLFIGTQKDNVRDCVKKGRCIRASGERQHLSKLTEDQVKDIRAMRKIGLRYRSIAKMFSISINNSMKIVNIETWKHVK